MKKSTKKPKSFEEFLEQDYFRIGKGKKIENLNQKGSDCNDDY
jgi:hypothetical protein